MQNWIDQHPSTMPLIVPLYLVCLWLLVATVISHMGGWATLAKHFRLETEFTGERWNFRSGQMRWRTNYNGCLTLGCNETGLYLAMMVLFRFRHPPLFIPWSEITVSRRRVFFFNVVRLELGREAPIPLTIRPKLADKLRRAAGGHWPAETIES